MKKIGFTAIVLGFGWIAGALISPLLAQAPVVESREATCFVGEASSAACSGDWIYFAGNTSGLDSGAWVVGINSETQEIWYKNGRRMNMLEADD